MNNQKDKGLKKLKNKLSFLYRLVILDEETFEEKYSLRINLLRAIKWLGLGALFFITITIFIIAFTPLKEYIPGYGYDFAMQKKLILLSEKVDSLEKNATAKDNLLKRIRGAISGNPDSFNSGNISSRPDSLKIGELNPNSDEIAFRAEIEEQERFSILPQASETRVGAIGKYHFFSPLKGKITTAFNPEKHHYGIDIVAPKNEAVKATLGGTVIFAGWASETGYTIHIQHENNLISVYKHNSVLLKKEGNKVKAGEAIAINGNSGELTTSPHLHFEIWMDGIAIDPMDLMVF